MAEAEQELVGGYHTEYSAMRFALFFLGEYAGMVTTSVVCVALFFGGWHVPYLDMIWHSYGGNVVPGHPAVTTSFLVCLVRSVMIFLKTIIIIFVFMWVRWSLPRFRFDQLMMLAWRALIPMSLGLMLMTAVVVWIFGPNDRAFMRIGGRMALVLLFGNIVVVAGSMLLSRLLPPPPLTNRRVRVIGSRFNKENLSVVSS
jgi:NADH-quinone oxidoreductase subunit H